MPHFFVKNREKLEIRSPFEDDRSQAAIILADFYREWQDGWQKAKDYYKINSKDEEIKFYENDQKEAVLRELSRILCDFEYDNGDHFEQNLRNLATELYPTILPEKNYFSAFLSTILKRHMGRLISLEEGRLRLEEPNLTEDVARRILSAELGIGSFNFIETTLNEDFSSEDFVNFVGSEIVEFSH